MISSDIASKWVDDLSGLVSPPDICSRVFELVDSPGASARDIGAVIAQDPNLTARLLKLVNSSLYNYRSKIDTVSRAVAIVGVRELYNLVLAVSAIKSFSKISSNIVSIDTFWRHSIFCAVISRDLARRCGVLHAERLFVAGMLHDIGSLVIQAQVPDIARDLLLVAEGNEESLYHAEKKELGFTHADLGRMLLKMWNIPESHQEAVGLHHAPNETLTENIEGWIIYAADRLANRSGSGSFFENPQGNCDIDPSVWATIGLVEEDADEEQLIRNAEAQFFDIVSFLLPKS